MLQLGLLFGMNEINADFVVARTESAVERHTIEPFGEVALRNLTTEHTLKIDDEVECHVIEMGSVDKNDVVQN